MGAILFYAAIICGFRFPVYLIRAIRSTDEENELPKNTFMACLTFGIVLLGIISCCIY